MITRQRLIRLIGLVGIVALLAVALPRVLGYLIQGPEQPQGDTDIRFTQIPIDFEHRTDLENSLPFLGIAAIDIDGDGIDEVFIGGGAHQDDAILRFNDKDLVRIAAPGISKQKGDATFGAASIDATRDGRADLFVARESGLYFYENAGGRFEGRKIEFPLEEHSVPSENHWLKVRLADAPSSIGAIVRVHTAAGRTFADQFVASQGLCSDQTHEIFFGLGKIDSIASVTVSYQDGRESRRDAPPVDTTVSFTPSR